MSLPLRYMIAPIPADYVQYEPEEKVLVDFGVEYKSMGKMLLSIFLGLYYFSLGMKPPKEPAPQRITVPGRVTERITYHGVHDMYVVDVLGQKMWLPNRLIRKYKPER